MHQELNSSNHIGVILGTVQDVTEQRESMKRIRQLAYSDSLTGLASRAYFLKHLADVIKASNRRSERFALLFLDMDGFKRINDSLGHEAGDTLLREVASRLQSVVRDTDFVARLSGDEFCILVDKVDEQYSAAYVAERCLQELEKPVQLGRQNVRPQCSIGIAHFPDNGDDSRSLLKAADTAMYAAKDRGKHCYVYYQPEFTEKAEKRLRIEQELRHSVDNDELDLVYQPQIDLVSGRMTGVEAMVVWNHPFRGAIPYAEFSEIAERIKFTTLLGNWVLNAVLQQAKEWHQMGMPELKTVVKISSSHLQDTDFVDMVGKALTENQGSPETLELEFSESITQASSKHSSIFSRLKEMDVKVAIDDFSASISSLKSLKQLPVNCLKINQRFIKDMLEDPESSILLGAIVGTAHALDHLVIAEGVENENQVQVLAAIGCDTVQGPHFSSPVPAQKIPALVNTEYCVKNKPQEKVIPIDKKSRK